MTDPPHRTGQHPARPWLYLPWRERKKRLRREAWLSVAVAYAVVVFAYLLPQNFRAIGHIYIWSAWTAFMIRTFLFHYGLLLLAVAVVAAVTRAWRMVAALGPLLLVTLGPAMWKLLPPNRLGDPDLTVMTVNLLAVNETTQPIIEEIKAVGPDVLLLQEYAFHWHDALEPALKDLYPFRAFERRNDSFGTAVYSKFAFDEPVQLDLPLGDATVPQIWAVIRVDDRKIAFYNVHVLPPVNYENIVETRAQFADLLKLLAEEELPTIVGGDFNFTGRSPQAAALRRAGFHDAHTQAGWGRGTTWPNISALRYLPAVRIDHLFLRGLDATACRTGRGQGSDHRPVIAELAIQD